MPGDFTRLQPGVPLPAIPASDWNRFADAARAFERTAAPTATAVGASSRPHGLHAQIKNSTGGARAVGEIVKIDSPIVTTTDDANAPYRGLQFVGTSPDSACEHDGWPIAVLQSSAQANELGAVVGVFSGMCWAIVNVIDASAHGFAKPDAGNHVLQSHQTEGYRIIWKAAGTGQQWAVIELTRRDEQILIGKVAAGSSITPEAGGLVDVYRGTGLAEVPAEEVPLQVTAHPWLLPAGTFIGAGQPVIVAKINGFWYAINQGRFLTVKADGAIAAGASGGCSIWLSSGVTALPTLTVVNWSENPLLENERARAHYDQREGIWYVGGGAKNVKLGKLDTSADLNTVGPWTVSIWQGAGGLEADTTANVQAYNWDIRSASLNSGTPVVVAQNDAGIWYLVHHADAPWIQLGVANESIDVSDPGPFDVQIFAGPGGSEADTGTSVEAHNWALTTGIINNGDQVLLGRTRNGVWYIIHDLLGESAGPSFRDIRIGKVDADADLSVTTGHTVSIWSGTAGSETDSTTNITARSWDVRAYTIPAGTQVLVGRSGDNEAWYILSHIDAPWVAIGILDETADLSTEGPWTVSLFAGAGGSEADTGVNVSVRNWMIADGELDNGDQVIIFRTKDNVWYLKHDLTGETFRDISLGKLDGTADLNTAGPFTVSVWSGSGGSETDSTTNVSAYNWKLVDATLVGGDQVMLGRTSSGVWYLIHDVQGEEATVLRDFKIGKLDSASDFSVSGPYTVSIWAGSGGSEADSTTNVSARVWELRSYTVPSGTPVVVARSVDNDVWYIISHYDAPWMQLGVTDSTIDLNSEGPHTISLFAGAGGSEADTGINISARNWMTLDASLESASQVYLFRTKENVWYFTHDRFDEQPTVFRDIRIGKVDADIDLSGAGPVTVSIWNGTAGSEVDSTVNVTAYNWLIVAETLATGTKVMVARSGDNDVWYLMHDVAGSEATVFRDFRIGKVDSATDLSSTSGITVSIWSGTAGSETDSTTNVTARSWDTRSITIPANTKVLLGRSGDNDTWYIISHFDQPWIQLGILDGTANLNNEGPFTVSIHAGAGGSETDSGVNVSAYNWIPVDETLDSGQEVYVARTKEGVWYIVHDLFPENEPIRDVRIGKTDSTADLSTGAAHTISIWSGTAGSETDSLVNVTARAWDQRAVILPAATKVLVGRSGDNEAWYIISHHDAPWIYPAKVDSTTNLGSVGPHTCSLYQGSGGAETDTGNNVSAYNWVTVSGQSLSAGSNVLVARSKDGVWYMIHDVIPTVFRDFKVGKNDATIDLSSHGPFTISEWGGAGGMEADTTTNFQVFNWQLRPGETIASGSEVMFARTDDNVWYLIYDMIGSGGGTPGAEPILFQLTATLSLGGSANALQRIWNGSAYVTTGSTITVRDAHNAWLGTSGAQGWAIERSADSHDYEIIWMQMPATMIEGTLTENMGFTISSRASASVQDYYDGRNPGTPITVFDTQAVWGQCQNGAKFKAHFDARSNRYEIVWCQHPRKWCRFTADTAFDRLDVSVVGDIKHSWDGHGTVGGTNNVTFFNQPDDSAGAGNYLWEGDAGGTGLAAYDPEAEKWWIVNFECVEE